jgi:hypothetical protein
MATLNIEGDAFHPEGNYTVKPRCREAPLEAPILRRLNQGPETPGWKISRG